MADTPVSAASSYPILIVDDNQLLRTILEASLKAAGHEVTSAENGRQALELFRKSWFPIVMTDWVMPEMDGLELCRAIRAEDTECYTFIILLTSQDSKNDIIAGLEAGADEYLVKPAHQVELVARLKTARRILDLEKSLQKSIEVNRGMVAIDPLTGIYSRRYMDERIPQEVKRANRYGRPMALMFLEINGFEGLAEEHGHFAGEQVLKGCADVLADSLRKDVDWIARYAEQRFLVVLPEKDAAGAMIVARRLRIRLASTVIKVNGKEIRMTASFGVSSFTPNPEKHGFSAQLLLDRADRCLCQAKEDANDSIKGVQLT